MDIILWTCQFKWELVKPLKPVVGKKSPYLDMKESPINRGLNKQFTLLSFLTFPRVTDITNHYSHGWSPIGCPDQGT